MKFGDFRRNSGQAGDGAKGGATALPTASGGLKIVAYTDTLTVPANEAVEFRMDLLVTPVKTLDTPRHFRRDRYYQYGYNGGASCQEIAAMGVEVLNLHQGVMLNPYINYRERPSSFSQVTVGYEVTVYSLALT